MREMRTMRSISFLLALVYNFFYFLAFFDFYYSANEAQKRHSPFSVTKLLVDLFLAFNIVMNAPIMSMNLVIIGKEIKFEFFQKNRVYYYGGERHDLKLGISDMAYAAEDAFNMINPFWWFNRLVTDVHSEEDELQGYLDSLSADELADLLNETHKHWYERHA